MSNVAYSTSVQADNRLAIARVKAGARIKAERLAREAQGRHPHGRECEDC